MRKTGDRDSAWPFRVVEFAFLVNDALPFLGRVFGHSAFAITATGVGAGMNAPSWALWLLWIAGAFLLWPLAYHGWRVLGKHFRPITFYPNLTKKINAVGDLAKELEGVREAWLGFESGDYYNANYDRPSMRCVTRILMLDPGGTYAPIFADRQGEHVNIKHLKSTIEEATRKAQLKEGRPVVKWYDGPLHNIVIAGPGSRCAWARIHYQLAGQDTETWPDFVIEWGRWSAAVGAVEGAFSHIWDKLAKDAPDLTQSDSDR